MVSENLTSEGYSISSGFRGHSSLLPILILLGLSFGFDSTHYPSSGTIPIIFDTDMEGDCDDVGALAVLHAFANAGICKIVAIGVDFPEPYSACCADVINTYFQRPDIPIGIVKNGPKLTSTLKYVKAITEQFPNDLKNSMGNIPDAVMVYRQALAGQPDTSVVFVAVGTKTILSQLLKSVADTISPLNGVDLVRKKVRLWVDMGGGYPGGYEYNMTADGPSSKYSVDNWPTPIVFSGYGLGNAIYSGVRLAPLTSPVRKAYELYGGIGRASWDLTTALFACRGLSPYWNLHTGGHNQVGNNGQNQWNDSTIAGKDQSYLVQKMAPDSVAKVLDSLLGVVPLANVATRLHPIRANEMGVKEEAVFFGSARSFGNNTLPQMESIGRFDVYDLRGAEISPIFAKVSRPVGHNSAAGARLRR
jgi:hypothetical protein